MKVIKKKRALSQSTLTLVLRFRQRMHTLVERLCVRCMMNIEISRHDVSANDSDGRALEEEREKSERGKVALSVMCQLFSYIMKTSDLRALVPRNMQISDDQFADSEYVSNIVRWASHRSHRT